MSVAATSDSHADLKYHADSGLLIVAGEPEALSAAADVVRAITNDIRERRDRARDIQKVQGLTNPDALESELADAQAQAEISQVETEAAIARAQAAEAQLDKAKAMHESGNLSEGELRSVQAQVLDARSQMQTLRIKAGRDSQRAAQAQEAFARAKAIAAGGGSSSDLDGLSKENAMLRDRLAEMEAQLKRLQDRMEADSKGKGGGSR
ncbi:MAG: hypothetical protein IPJ41_08930 [Phycisphaerales bacterium]|nr:hypothetical protein [Phycisphaerales bacterium]